MGETAYFENQRRMDSQRLSGILNPPVMYLQPSQSTAPQSSQIRRYGGGGNVDLRNLSSYWNPAMANIGQQASPQVTIMAPPGGGSQSGDWRSEAHADAARFRAQMAARSQPHYIGGGGGGVIPAPQVRMPEFKPLTSPELPEFKAREYKPPKEDEGVYRSERRKAMAPGLRELRQRTQEAMIMSRSLANPTARSEFVRDSLEGYGRGLERVAAGAGREARTEAARKRTEQLNLYNSKYKILSSQDAINYQNKLQKIATDFASRQQANMLNYQNMAGRYAGGGAISAGAARTPQEAADVRSMVHQSYQDRLAQLRAARKRFSRY